MTDKEVFQALNWTVNFPQMMGKVQSNLPGCAELGMALEEVLSNLFWKLMSTHQAPGHAGFLCQVTLADLQTQYMTEGDMWRISEACFLRVPVTS